MKLPLPYEVETHIALADLLRASLVPGWLWTHFPAGEVRNKATAARLWRMGLHPGFADFLLISPAGVHHWLELKRGNARSSAAQKEFASAMMHRGVPYALARTFTEAVGWLKRWGVIRGTPQ